MGFFFSEECNTLTFHILCLKRVNRGDGKWHKNEILNHQELSSLSDDYVVEIRHTPTPPLPINSLSHISKDHASLANTVHLCRFSSVQPYFLQPTKTVYSPSHLPSICRSTDSQLKLWSLTRQNALSTFKGHTNEKNFVGLATDGDYIACGKNALIWWRAGQSPRLGDVTQSPVRLYIRLKNWQLSLIWQPGYT